MIPKQDVRSALTGAGEAGDDYQTEVVGQIEDVFGAARVRQNPSQVAGVNRPAPLDLAANIALLNPFDFLIEAKFEVPTGFGQALGIANLHDSNGLELDWSDLNPDILLVVPSRQQQPELACKFGVEPDGTQILLDEYDNRLQLRVIDVKLASEPGAHYFAEVVYYSMALSAWLQASGWNAQFVVAGNGAVWPGTYDKSKLWQKHVEATRTGLAATIETLFTAMEDDLEVAEFGVYVPRVRRFFQVDLPRIISTPWQDLPWHLNYRCSGCDFMGYDWNVPGKSPSQLSCWPQAQRDDHLSRIHGLTKGAAQTLRANAVNSVNDVAVLADTAEAWQSHSALRSQKEAIRARAVSLRGNAADAIANGGASAIVPSWADLRIYLTLDYDPSTALTAVFSMRASWREPAPFGVMRVPKRKRWGSKNDGYMVRVVMDRDIDAEKNEFLGLLYDLKGILDEVRNADTARIDAANAIAQQNGGGTGTEPRSTYQIYLWDSAQFRQLCRLVTRHMAAIVANPDLATLAWLFPSEDILPDHEFATRKSPISLVGEAVEAHLALPVPHYYPINEVAQTLLAPSPPPALNDYYRDPLTNLIPPERLYEFWKPKRTQNKMSLAKMLETNSALKTLALAKVTGALIVHPGVNLANSAAPTLEPTLLTVRSLAAIKATPESMLWYEWAKLENALSEVEAQMFYALPPKEREARFGSAHLTSRLEGREKDDAIQRINATCDLSLRPDADLLVYRLSQNSRDIKIKMGEFTWALSPYNEPLFLDKTVMSNASSSQRLPNAHRYAAINYSKKIGALGLTDVSLAGIDRQNLLIALRMAPDFGAKLGNRILNIEQYGDADFRSDVMLDPTHGDFWVSKVKKTFEAIGQPTFPTPSRNSRGEDILPQLPPRLIQPQQRGRRTIIAHEVLYRPNLLHLLTVSRSTPIRSSLIAQGVSLNPSQWDAWATALTRRLTLIWGPPGTGKSETLRAIARGAVVDAQNRREQLRVLIYANNYNAVDNVLLKLQTDLAIHAPDAEVFRVQSNSRPVPASLASYNGLTNIELEKDEDATRATTSALRTRLFGTAGGVEITILGTVPGQLHKIAVGSDTGIGAPIKEWFDLIIVDEASQLDVSAGAVALSKLAPNGVCVFAGDDLQLPPIQQGKAPEGLETLVGSLYSYLREYHGVEPCPLRVNYRSNSTIVNATVEAGYHEAKLTAHSPNLRLGLQGSIPITQPANWPATLPFSAAWATLLDPEKPLTCFVYDDSLSGQSNEFEAQVTASLIRCLSGMLGENEGRIDADGNPVIRGNQIYTTDEFWRKGVGVVAPHRAQGSRITDLLRQNFPNSGPLAPTSDMIAGAVDTVERYQGQQRDIIIASFGLGDPELIALEDEFLYDLRRFNVLISRACSKVVLILSRSVLEHLSNDQDVVRDSALLKKFVEMTCCNEVPMSLPFLNGNGVIEVRDGIMRWA